MLYPRSVTLAEMPKFADDPHLARQAALLTMGEIGRNLEPYDWEVDDELGNIDSMTTIAAVEGGTVLAVGSLDIPTPAVPSVGDIRILAVAPDYRGIGLGRDVVGLLEKRAKEAGVRRLFVQSLSGATGFYERLGYQEVSDANFAKLL